MASASKKKKPVTKKTAAKKIAPKRAAAKKTIVQPRAFTFVERLSNVYHEQDLIRIILDVAGHYHIPTNQPGIKSKKLKENLNYTPNLLQILIVEMDKYVKTIKPDVSLSDDDIGKSKTVQDILDVVVTKIK